MRAIRFALLALSRDWRSGELAVLLAALLVAVTALTGVGFFTDRIGQAVDQRAAEVLAAGRAVDDERGVRRQRGLDGGRCALRHGQQHEAVCGEGHHVDRSLQS